MQRWIAAKWARIALASAALALAWAILMPMSPASMNQSCSADALICSIRWVKVQLPWALTLPLLFAAGLYLHFYRYSPNREDFGLVRWVGLANGVAYVLAQAPLPVTPEMLPWFRGLVELVFLGLSLRWLVSAFGHRTRAWPKVRGVVMFVTGTLLLGVLEGLNRIWPWLPDEQALWPWAHVVLCYLFVQWQVTVTSRFQTAMMAALQLQEQRVAEAELALEASFAQLSEQEQANALAQERTRLMQEMHDGIGSSLHAAARAVRVPNLSSQALGDVLEDCLTDMHLVLNNATEPALTILPDLTRLLEVLHRSMTRRASAAGYILLWQVDEVPVLGWLDAAASLHTLRILQAAIGNAIQHTQSNEIRIYISTTDKHVGIHVEDNGQGFDLDKVTKGRGIQNVKTRAEILGGEATWRLVANGTRFTLWLPLSK